MEDEKWLGILTSINADNNLNESNIIEKIKEKLEKEDPGTYQEWQDNKFDINYTFNNQFALLHIAAENGYIDIVKALIGKGANVDAVDCDECTPLHYAIKNGYVDTANALIEKKANVDAVDCEGYTPLHYAAKNGYVDIVNILIEKKANVDKLDGYGHTPLHFAAENGYIDIVKALIGKKANVDAVDCKGYTPLHYAVKNGHTEIVKALIGKGAKVDVVDRDECTPLHYAVENGLTEIVNILIEKKGVNVNMLSESDNVTPLHLAVKLGHAKIVKALMKKGADPSLGNKNYRTLKRLIELIKDDSLEHLPRKAEETTTGEQVDDEYELLKYSLLFRNDCPLIDNVRRDAFDSLLCTWFAGTSDLTPKRKELGKKLLSILKGLSYSSDCDKDILRDFLLKNKDDDDLKCILNLTRGESKLTILHVVSSMDSKLAEKYVNLLLEAGADPNIKDDRGKTLLHYASYNNIGSLIKAGADPNMEDSEGRMPLHYAAGIGDKKSVNAFLEHGADSSKKNKQGKTPLQVAIDNHNYHVEECFLTDEQESLRERLVRMVDGCRFNGIDEDFTYLEGFLSEYENNQDFKKILNLRDHKGKSEILLRNRIASCLKHFHDGKAPYEKVEELLLRAGAVNYKGLDGKEHSPESGTLWDDLILSQQKKLKWFLHEVNGAQDMNQLEQVVTKAIESGVRFNFLIHPGEMMYQDTYNFTDCVMKKISALKKSSKVENDIEVASGIVCKFVSKGAVLHNLSSIDVIDILKSEFKDHKTNMKKAHEEYVNNTLKFMEVVRGATNGKLKDAKMDNSTFYLEYSEDSIIDVAKITDGARSLGLTQGKIEYGRDIVKIGKSEVEIITKNGIRNYTDLAGNSDIALTFHTSKGELEVRCMVPESDGILSSSFKESLWDRYYMGAPKQHRRFVEQYKIEKRA